ncbi:MAG: hypothetical protein AAGA03_17015, partial [Planctomycetota bacterium]
MCFTLRSLCLGDVQRFLGLFLAAGLLVTSGGCRLCGECDVDNYAAFGGAWERTVPDRGRVGSVFDPAGGRAAQLADRDSVEDGLRSDQPSASEDLQDQRDQPFEGILEPDAST